MSFQKFRILIIWLIVSNSFLLANPVQKIEPPFWWAGMQEKNLQLLVYGKNISTFKPAFSHDGILLNEIVLVENPNYLFLYITIDSQTKPGKVPVTFTKRGEKPFTFLWEIKEREPGSAERKGFDQSDVIYLLMPDRFSNGNPSNDNMPGMLEKANRENPLGRHGGDIRGIINQLDYLADLGITALWHNPTFENNQDKLSYHGYAITDFYKTDPRLGSNEEYLELVSEAGKRNIKVIKDMIFNHCGSNHWWVNDLPSGDWVHQWPEYTKTHYRGTTIVDPHVAQSDLDVMLKGWFDRNMPDLNQRNRLLATYLIQNSIWWVEFSGIKGIRMDTQPYPYKEFMAEWAERVMTEYPNFTLVGEAWMPKASLVSYYQRNVMNHDGYNSHLPAVFDFPLYYAINKAFNEEAGWDTGLIRLYDALTEDFLYSDPFLLVVFGDNHDLDRLFTSLDEDLEKLKMVMTFLLTTRGTPMIYYGTEILKTGLESTNHGHIRTDFPGGWAGDSKNAFTTEGRNDSQNEAFGFIKNLLNYRKTSTALQYGKLTHFIPENNVYVYFRSNNEQKIMVILNSNADNKLLSTQRFAEMIQGVKEGTDIITGKDLTINGSIEIPAKSSMVIELK
jgi:neopullulanase